ncbi:MAG: MBL fold metallo-hydrolase [Xanthomonadaceae bacterium]|jgi:glyoxylase-like metal-dependent hydrolase (beta-lactamase superfamily II)|nr:MBL fold metallo-hydrolase [Xanthomonadaceae bacterium]
MIRSLFRLFCLLTLATILGACGGTTPSAPTDPNTSSVSPPRSELHPSPLTLQVYTPQLQSIIPASSTILYGEREAILIDAQFASGDAWKLEEIISKSGKTLTAIYISHHDPAFYFGLEALQRAFPEAKILATPQTIEGIRANGEKDLSLWTPQLRDNAPGKIVIPDPIPGNTLMLEDQELQIIGLDGPDPERTFVWIPSIRTVVAGVTVSSGEHIWMADARTPQSRAHWLVTLQRIEALQPERVIPGRFSFDAPQDLEAVRFTADYVQTFDRAAAEAKNADQLIDLMEQQYPQLPGDIILEISARIVKNEIRWR